MKQFLMLNTLFLLLFFSACAPRGAMIKVDTLVAQGEYKNAAKFSQKKIDLDDIYAKDNLLWQLQTAYNYLLLDEINSSTISYFDNSEMLMKHYRQQRLSEDISQTLSATLLNDTTRPYIGTEYDGIMTNTYKAIEYMKLGDTNSARVEFNRAIDRQRRAKIFFNKMIKKEQAAIDKKELESQKKGENLKVEDSEIDTLLKQKYSNLHNFKAYPDFVNPTTNYIAGLFARANGDGSKADYLLKESYGMMQSNDDVRADFMKENFKQTVWLIFENGQAPILKEWRIDFPIWIFSSNLSYISLALPKLEKREVAYPYLNVNLDDNRTIQTKFLSSMDRVIQTEFKKSYDSTVHRAILSAATKTAINYAISQNSSGSTGAELVRLATTVYQIVSTRADTRIWSTLPKEFQLARFERPKSGEISIRTPENLLVKNITLPDTQNILIYVKIATPYALASVRVIPF